MNLFLYCTHTILPLYISVKHICYTCLYPVHLKNPQQTNEHPPKQSVSLFLDCDCLNYFHFHLRDSTLLMLFHCSGWFSLVAEALFQNVRFKQMTLSIFSHLYWLLRIFDFCGTSVMLTNLQIKKKKKQKCSSHSQSTSVQPC